MLAQRFKYSNQKYDQKIKIFQEWDEERINLDSIILWTRQQILQHEISEMPKVTIKYYRDTLIWLVSIPGLAITVELTRTSNCFFYMERNRQAGDKTQHFVSEGWSWITTNTWEEDYYFYLTTLLCWKKRCHEPRSTLKSDQSRASVTRTHHGSVIPCKSSNKSEVLQRWPQVRSKWSSCRSQNEPVRVGTCLDLS